MENNNEEQEPSYIDKWYGSTEWSKRPKAVCKPCWEIKYCPYGPLVEDFPLKEVRDDKSCRIFGHDCPVFSVAEPFTETRELRNISRQIPRVTQFRVLKRENQICSDCGRSVKDGEIEFDHIIPWSKGGSSEESNVRLLCMTCNRRKGKKYEETYLVKNVNDHAVKPETETMIFFLKVWVGFGHEWIAEHNIKPVNQNFADNLADGNVSHLEDLASEYFGSMEEFFGNKRPAELSKRQFDALKIRWGFRDGTIYKIKDVIKIFSIEENEYFNAEKNLIQRLGIRMSDSKNVVSKWKKL